MPPIPCSVIIITKNEERNILKCIASVRDFDEVFVVDSCSIDRTRDLAAEAGAQVVTFEWNGKYPKKKQWSLENLPFSNDWVLWVDADEEVTRPLAEELRTLLTSGPTHQGYFVRYDYVFRDRVLKHGQQVYKLVFHNRFKGRFIEQDDLDVKTTGDQEVHVHPFIDGSVGVLRSPMLHNDHDTLHHYFDRHNWYSDWEGSLRARRLAVNTGAPQPGIRGQMKRVFDRLPGKPLMMFTYSFLMKQGFRDGSAGFHFAVSKAVYYWQIGLKIDEFKKKHSSIHQFSNTKRAQIAYYDEEADPEFEITRPHGTPRFYHQLLDEKFRRSVAGLGRLSGRSTLTVCGGSGMDAEYLARAGVRVVASDLSVGAASRARQRFGRFLPPETGSIPPIATTADVEQLPFPDRSIDLVYVHDGLHHLEDPAAGLREMCRVASWAISLTEPADAAITGLAVKLGRAEFIEEAGNRVARLDLPTVTRILEEEGFTIVRAQRYAMYYKHHPGWVMRLLSLPVLNSLAWLAFDLGNFLIGRWGNKMTVRAIRMEDAYQYDYAVKSISIPQESIRAAVVD